MRNGLFFSHKRNQALDFNRMEGVMVPNKSVSGDKREKAIAACLDQFCNKGLYETTSRDLSKALKLQSGGMYQYFQTKDEAVIVCAEEAAFLLEKYLVKYAIHHLDDVDSLFDQLMERANKLSHMMRFFAQVCCVPKYREGMEPVLSRLTERYGKYAQQIAEHLHCDLSVISPYFNICVTTISDYMIFGEKENAMPQLCLVKQIFKNCQNGGMTKNESE